MRLLERKTFAVLGYALVALLIFVVLLPMLYVIYHSFLAFDASKARDVFSLQNWCLVLTSKGIQGRFYNSLFLSIGTVLVHLAFSCMAGYALAIYKIKFRKIFLFLFFIFVVMPIQVTLMPNFIILNKLHLLNTWWALFLPAVFSPFGAIWMYISFAKIPAQIIEAAKLDGASLPLILRKIVVPSSLGAVFALGLLCFADSWSMVEQPLVFIYDIKKYPISVFLAIAETSQFSTLFVCGVLALLPILVLYPLAHKALRNANFTAAAK